MYQKYLGDYDKNIVEHIERSRKLTVYYPNGFDIRIEVIRGLYDYTVTIGDVYTKTFEYTR